MEMIVAFIFTLAMSPAYTPHSAEYSAHEPTQSPRDNASQVVSSAVAPFLASLFEILSKEDAHIIGWSDDGKSFGVYNYDAMEQHILPTYFRHNKFASFQRQLNYFGFRKLHKAKDSDHHSVYCQPYFLRHDPSRMLHIKRKTHRIKSNTPRRAILGSINDGYPYQYRMHNPDSPAYYSPPLTAESSPSMYTTHDMYSCSTPTPFAPASAACALPQVTSSDAYDPVPFFTPSTSVFMSVQSPSSASQPTADLQYDPFLSMKRYGNHVSVSNVVVYTSPDDDTLSSLPIPYSDVQRDSVKLTRDDLDFLYDDALCI
ncbi:hypothetical protein DYB26_003465 [Aphanomyces astaci]|nr:hypothetical protein DYB31_007592 [Aphanomyces astaci]RHZ15089.1 hypothetical protein DYB26_003465 [Aphanomyces astaci]